jgi:hypothetical protein
MRARYCDARDENSESACAVETRGLDAEWESEQGKRARRKTGTHLLQPPRNYHQPTLHLRHSDLELLPLGVGLEIRSSSELLNRFDDGEELGTAGMEFIGGGGGGGEGGRSNRALASELRFETGNVIEEDLSISKCVSFRSSSISGGASERTHLSALRPILDHSLINALQQPPHQSQIATNDGLGREVEDDNFVRSAPVFGGEREAVLGEEVEVVALGGGLYGRPIVVGG